ncbi:hypothetical protein QQ045_009228 [Rhodiola kirilowii]
MESFGNHNQDPPPQPHNQLPTHSSGSAVFDASQYAFFGNDVHVDEVELGGLEEDDEDNTPSLGFNDDQYPLEIKEVGLAQSISDVDDLASSLCKLNSKFNEFGEIGDSVDRVASSKDPYVTQWKQGGSIGWPAQQTFHSENTLNSNVLSSELLSSYAHPADSQPFHRTSYPQQQPLKLESLSGDQLLAPESSFTTYPPPGAREQFLPNFHEHPLNMPYRPQTVAILPPNSSSSNAPFQVSKVNHASHFNVEPLPLAPHIQKLPSQWENQAAHYSANNTSLLSSVLHQSPSQNGATDLLFLQREHNLHQIQPSHGHLIEMQFPFQNSQASSGPFVLRKFDHMLALADRGNQWHKLVQNGGQDFPSSRQSYELVRQRNGAGWPVFRSKYMTTDELENILRAQQAATHSNDPYVDDYYHQASLAKKAAKESFKHHFCPAQLRDSPPGARANSEPHAFLQVEALGRVPFSSIHRPRPLLEVDPPVSLRSNSREPKAHENPLEQDPMLVARLAIEDGQCLLLDVDDIDRFLQFNQLLDGGAHLKRKRQALLERLAASLRLVDPLGNNFQTGGVTSENDLVFLRLISLPKGQKLLAHYIQHLLPGDELIRVVSMAILRNSRFVFGCLSANPRAAETTAHLATVVASSVGGMDLGALSACLAAVVCSSEQAPLRPIGSLAGDGASLILISVLQRATDVLTDPRANGTYNASNRAIWQSSFDDFFGLLTTYCMSKYDSVMQTLLMQNTPGTAFLGSEAASAISKEMPVDLLRASLPHTNEQQRKLLLDFAKRSMH